ncbi:MAG: protein kinase [Pseudomonadota bacterium]
MTSDLWEQKMALFDAASELPPEERDAFLVNACGDDAALLDSLRRLLAQADKTDDADFIGAAAAELVTAPPRDGEVFGQYRLIRKIGGGGMGDVYLAERADGEYTVQVAIKLMHGSAQSEQMLARFRAERQILAQLQHPNVAQLLDGGASDDGQPYFVMEYVDGQPLDRYCDEKQLSIAGRLRLFANVCRAVAYAHGALVVHRDLKPSNILVTESGDVKLLDFGIAKVIDAGVEDAQLTRTGMSVMTPTYASPEQALGRPIAVASDIYSLGVNLYQLMSGRLPYTVDSRNPVQAAEIISSVEPARVSTVITDTGAGDSDSPEKIAYSRASDVRQLVRRLSGDIDMICGKAMHKEPGRRYASALELAADIERHLNGLPITARPDSFGYRAGKFLSRHVWATAASVAVVAIIAGLVGTYTWQLSVAKNEAEDVTGFLQGVLMSATPGELGAGGNVVDIVHSAAERLDDEFNEDPRTKARIRHVLGASYFRMARYAEAEVQTVEALSLREAVLGPGAFETRRTRANLMSIRYMLNKDVDDLLAAQDEHEPREPDRFTFNSDSMRRSVAMRDGDMDRALAIAEQVYTKYQDLLDEGDRQRIRSGLNFAVLLMDFGRYDESIEKLEEAIGFATAADEKDLVNVLTSELALVYHRTKRYEEALALNEIELEFNVGAFGRESSAVAITLSNMSQNYLQLGRVDEAIATAQEALDLMIQFDGPMHQRSINTRRMLATTVSAKDMAAARPLYEQAIAEAREKWPEGHFLIGEILHSYAASLAGEGLHADAAAQAELAWSAYEQAPNPSVASIKRVAELLARTYERLGESDRAAEWARTAASMETSEST